MESTIFGIFISVILFYKFINQNRMYDKFMETVTFIIIVSALFFDMGYLVKVNDLKLDYYKFLYVINILFIFFYIVRTKKFCLSKKQFLLFFILNLSIILCLTVFYFYDFDILILTYRAGFNNARTMGESILSTINIGNDNYVSFATLILFEIFILVNTRWINKKTFLMLKKFFHIIFILIIIEFMITNIFGINVREIWNFLLGVRDSQVTDTIYRYGFNVAYGTFSEPSHVAGILLIYYNLYCLNKVTCRKDSVFFVISIIVGIVSGSASTFSVIILVLLYKFFHSIFNKIGIKEFLIIQILLLLGISAIAYLIIYNDSFNENIMVFINRIQNFIFNSGGNSEVARASSIKFVMQSFTKSPFFGVGYGSTAAPGLIPTILANFGIINLFFYVQFILFAIKSNFIVEFNFIKILINAILWFSIGQFSYTYSPIMFVIVFSMINGEELGEEATKSKIIKDAIVDA